MDTSQLVQVRLECLRMAIGRAGTESSVTEIIALAKALADFVIEGRAYPQGQP